MATKKKPPERLSDDEWAYHRRALAQVSAVQGAFQLWEGHLRQKYALGPEDLILEDGVIQRGSNGD